jgi:ribosome recycling factor
MAVFPCEPFVSDANERIKKVQAEGKVSEDDSFRGQEEIQKLTDKYIKDVDHVLEGKNKELAGVYYCIGLA